LRISGGNGRYEENEKIALLKVKFKLPERPPAINFAQNLSEMKTPLSRLRVIGNIEGISYLLLLGIAMPLKYLASIPEAVRIAGSIHGFLFVGFMVALAQVWRTEKWSIKKVAVAFILSLVPFGTFYLDKQIRQEEGLQTQNV
jgi:integral membrane protein